MDLSKMSPKDKQRYEIAMERKESLLNDLKQDVVPDDYEDIIYAISRAEYKRGKADAGTESVQKPSCSNCLSMIRRNIEGQCGCGKEISYCSNGGCVNHCGEYEDICDNCSRSHGSGNGGKDES